MNDDQRMNALRSRIAQTVAQRDALKLALERGAIQPRHGLRELMEIDARLSQLDSEFKALWDRHNPPRNQVPQKVRSTRSSSSGGSA